MGETNRRKSSFLTRRTKPSNCLNCGALLDSFTNPKENDKTKPYPGSIAICIKCHHIMVYDDNLKVRNLTDQEIIDVAGHPEVLRIMRVLDEIVKEVNNDQAKNKKNQT